MPPFSCLGSGREHHCSRTTPVTPKQGIYSLTWEGSQWFYTSDTSYRASVLYGGESTPKNLSVSMPCRLTMKQRSRSRGTLASALLPTQS